MSIKWHVARTKTGGEVRASVTVAACGFDVFLPVHLVQRRHAGKREQVSRPLFPRYLFVAFDPTLKAHGCINHCRGVANRGLIVTGSGEPVPVPDAVIAQIRKREASMLARAGEVTTGYQPGDTFLIAKGQFASIQATYMGEEKGKVSALVHLFGSSHVVSLDFEQVPGCTNTVDRIVA